MNEDDTSRRPMVQRGWPVFQKLAAWLAGKGVRPNTISIASILFAAITACALFATGLEGCASPRLLWLLAALSILGRLVANLLDGLVAVEHGAGSPEGELYNEVPDRVSDALTLVGAGYAAGGSPAWGYVAALLAVFVAYVRAIGAAAGARHCFAGPMAKPQRMGTMIAICVYMAVTPSGWQPVCPANDYGLVTAGLILISAGCGITAFRRLRAARDDLRGKAT